MEIKTASELERSNTELGRFNEVLVTKAIKFEEDPRCTKLKDELTRIGRKLVLLTVGGGFVMSVSWLAPIIAEVILAVDQTKPEEAVSKIKTLIAQALSLKGLGWVTPTGITVAYLAALYTLAKKQDELAKKLDVLIEQGICKPPPLLGVPYPDPVDDEETESNDSEFRARQLEGNAIRPRFWEQKPFTNPLDVPVMQNGEAQQPVVTHPTEAEEAERYGEANKAKEYLDETSLSEDIDNIPVINPSTAWFKSSQSLQQMSGNEPNVISEEEARNLTWRLPVLTVAAPFAAAAAMAAPGVVAASSLPKLPQALQLGWRALAAGGALFSSANSATPVSSTPVNFSYDTKSASDASFTLPGFGDVVKTDETATLSTWRRSDNTIATTSLAVFKRISDGQKFFISPQPKDVFDGADYFVTGAAEAVAKAGYQIVRVALEPAPRADGSTYLDLKTSIAQDDVKSVQDGNSIK